ncbi:predicted protein [Plenodomus lingam JN3]|uniref:Predicted protein n=1 Tax=Leptosphaeria maculans (strain JN3 / isolate v23.1.3 / race Av1-4-5-6-7-8) TaxID=985895 RepID=E4ZK01_LEPMJ|nr:predicted protein [Plenodomus lingam JN3]CBX91596.1 predicted protein [Plenodomus lingam JN3]
MPFVWCLGYVSKLYVASDPTDRHFVAPSSEERLAACWLDLPPSFPASKTPCSTATRFYCPISCAPPLSSLA